MSQVRKLLNGNLIPKAENGYKFKLDSQEYIVTDEQLKEIDDKIALLEPKHRRFLGNWTNAIKSGSSSGNRASNTVTMNMLSGIEGRDVDRLKRKTGSYWETITGKDSYYAKEAINEALNITASVLKTTPVQKSDDSAKKTTVEKSFIDLDFNEKNGKKYLSPTSENNLNAKKRIADLLTHLQAGDASSYDYSAYNTDAISSWLNGQKGEDKYKAASDYFDNLWTIMSKSGYTYNPDVEDLLKMFGINYGLTASTGNVGSAGSTTGSGSIGSGTVSSGVTGASTGNTKIGDIITVLDKNYKVIGFKDNGDPILEEITNTEEIENVGNEEGAETKPIQTQNLVLIKPGDRDDMDWGVYYKGVPYSYESIQPGSDLGNIMAQFEANNKMLWSQGKRYNENSSFTLPSGEKISMTLPSIKNFADWTVGQILDDGTDLNQFFLEQGITSAALSHVATDSKGNRYFKYYNNFNPTGTYIPREGNTPKETPWGIRSPYYLMIDEDGNIKALTSEPTYADYKENIVNTAPKFKDLYNPTTSAWSRIEQRHPYDNTYFRSHSDRIPATEIGTIYIGKDKYKLYKRTDGRLYLDGPKGKDAYFTEAGLYDFIKNAKQRHKEGGTISKTKTNAFTSKFGNVVKGQDGIPNLVVKKDSSVTPLKVNSVSLPNVQTVTKRVDEKGRVLIEDGNGNMLIIDSEQEPIPEEIANSVARPIDPNQKTINDFVEASSKPGPAVIQPPFYIKNPPINYPEPKVSSTRIGNVENNENVTIPKVPLAEQKVVPIKTNKKSDLNDLVEVLKQLVTKKQHGGIVKGQEGINGITYNYSVHPWVRDLFTTLNIVENNTLYRDKEGQWLNGEKTREGIDWGIKQNGVYTPIGDISPAPMIYPKKEAYQMAANNIFSELYPAYGKPDLTNYRNVDVNEEEVKEELPKYQLQVSETKENPSVSLSTTSAQTIGSQNGVDSEEIDDGGGYIENIPDRSKHLIPLISMIRFGINAGLQRKYRDTAKKAVEAARFNELPVRLHTPRTDNPALDRALQQVQSERMQGIKPVTSDLIANNALWNQREGQLWDREQSIIGQRSQSDWEAKKEVLNVMNQNQMNEISTANSNRARNASINSALYNPELQYIQRRGQSIENLGLEIQNNIKRDRNVILDYRKQLELQRQTQILNNKLDQLFPNARRAYDLLSEDEKLNYADYTDFLRKTYPTEWTANIDTINKLQDEYTNSLRQWMYENGLNYSYPSFLTGKSSRVGYNKKGGYLRGSTRYTMEPDERIWVENNKATHKAIGKLSDNTIKLLLRALK